MFGLTGAGKSALSNLIAGHDSGALIPRVLPFQRTISAFSLCRTIFSCLPYAKNCPDVFFNVQFDSQARWGDNTASATWRSNGCFFWCFQWHCFCMDGSEVAQLDSIMRLTKIAAAFGCFSFWKRITDIWKIVFFWEGGGQIYRGGKLSVVFQVFVSFGRRILWLGLWKWLIFWWFLSDHHYLRCNVLWYLVQVWSWQWILSGPWCNWPGWGGNWPKQGGKGMEQNCFCSFHAVFWWMTHANGHVNRTDSQIAERGHCQHPRCCLVRSVPWHKKRDFFDSERICWGLGIELMTHDLNQVFSRKEPKSSKMMWPL